MRINTSWILAFVAVTILALSYLNHPPREASADYYLLTGSVDPVSAVDTQTDFDSYTDTTDTTRTQIEHESTSGCTGLPQDGIGIHTFDVTNGPCWEGSELDDAPLEITVRVENSMDLMYGDACLECCEAVEGCVQATSTVLNVELALQNTSTQEVRWITLNQQSGTENAWEVMQLNIFGQVCDDQLKESSTPNQSTWFKSETFTGGGSYFWQVHKLRVSVPTDLVEYDCGGDFVSPWDTYDVEVGIRIDLLEIETIFE